MCNAAIAASAFDSLGAGGDDAAVLYSRGYALALCIAFVCLHNVTCFPKRLSWLRFKESRPLVLL